MLLESRALVTVRRILGIAVPGSIGLRDMPELDTAEIRRHVQQRHQAAVENAYRRGRRLVIDLATAAARDTSEDVRGGPQRAGLAAVAGRLRHYERDEATYKRTVLWSCALTSDLDPNADHTTDG